MPTPLDHIPLVWQGLAPVWQGVATPPPLNAQSSAGGKVERLQIRVRGLQIHENTSLWVAVQGYLAHKKQRPPRTVQ